jgi:hypothetical protein
VLIQSDDGSLVQHLPPGSYEVAVSGRSGAGIYQLIVKTVPAGAPFDPVASNEFNGFDPGPVAVADVNGDGKPDLIAGDFSGAGPTPYDEGAAWQRRRHVRATANLCRSSLC